MLPLDGIIVVTLEQAVAGPFATRQLADLGARVIKIERPHTGDFARGYDETVHGMASIFVWLNRSKESLTLNLKHPRAPEIMSRLIERADVFLQNLAPGAAARLGLSAEALLARFPRLIVCDISGYGDSGPYRDKKAYDLLIQGEAGLISVTGTPEVPSKTGISTADISAGMYAYSGILAALLQREKSGKGTRVEVSMFETLCEWMMFPLYYAHFGGVPFTRSGPNHATIFPYGPFRAGDGKVVIIGIQNEPEWKVFCERVLKRPELCGDSRFGSNSRRLANREALGLIIESAFAQLKTKDLLELLDAAGIANSQMNNLEDVWNHPQLANRKRWRTVESGAGPIPVLLPPGMPSGAEPRLDRIPELGANVEALLTELGYSRPEIEHLRAEQVV
ncbi:MAG: CoA transferase [Acidobacteriia bacterium]|nr:CoA transferase [Terriglobia bacterium]